MTGNWLTGSALVWICAVGAIWADTHEIGLLRVEHKRLTAVQDSLDGQRWWVVAEAEELSARIDSLKVDAEDDDPEKLHEALRTSLVLVQRMVDIDRALERVKGEQDSLKGGLRLAYDWEIGVLIQKISQEPDEGLLTQLMVYQEAREILGNEPFGANLRYGEEMAISSEDGPDEIRQKMELMEDLATRLQIESLKNMEQLQRLEEEHRLRARVRVFTSEISLFDEHLPEGRVLVRRGGPVVAVVGGGGEQEALPIRGIEEGDVLGEGFEKMDDVAVGGALAPSPPLLLSQRELVRGGRMQPLEGLGGDEVVLEIHKLKAHQQEIRQLEGVVRERAVIFRKHLQKMLEGEE